MQVGVPIASVKRFVKAGNNVAFDEGGGRVVNHKSKEKVKCVCVCVELGGVYFLKA